MKWLLPIALLVPGLVATHATSQQKESRAVIVAARRNHQVVIFDARTLAELGHFIVGDGANSVTASADGRTLFIEQPPPSEPRTCCALFSLDLATGSLCQLIFPSSRAVASPDGRLLFTQRGAVGVEVFDAKALTRQPVIKAPGNYGLSVSPDSHWLFGMTIWQGPSLDIFDIERGVLVRRIRLQEGLLTRGAWLGNQYYLYAHDGKQGNIWKVATDTTELGSPMKVPIPIAAREDKPIGQEVIAAGNRLIVYEPVAWWFHSVRMTDVEALAGLFAIDDATGAVEHWAQSIDFAQVVASPDARYLYAINAGTQASRPPALLKLDGKTGAVLKKRDLDRDVWFITAARIPDRVIPRGEAMTTTCQQ